MQHLNGEVNPALQRNHQETMEQKMEAAAWFGTLRDEVKFLQQKAQESDQKMAFLIGENDTLRARVQELERSQVLGGLGPPLHYKPRCPPKW